MRHKWMAFITISFILVILIVCSKQDDFPVLKGPYLGQKPPGMIPEVFAPGILNTDKMGAFCSVFSPNGNEFYFVYYQRGIENSGALSVMRKVNDVWSQPETLPFDSDTNDNDMCLSSDGNRLIFRSWRDLPDGSRPDDHSWLWFAQKTQTGWSEAKPLLCGGETVRTGYPSISNDGTLYFAHRRDGLLGIYRSEYRDNAYQSPEFVYTVIDTSIIHGDMFIAPDESYFIVSCRDREGNIGHGLLDLYIAFQKIDGTWTEAIHMGDAINTAQGENCPQVSPDGKYFFFNRYDPDADVGNIYWVDAKIIEELKPEGLK